MARTPKTAAKRKVKLRRNVLSRTQSAAASSSEISKPEEKKIEQVLVTDEIINAFKLFEKVETHAADLAEVYIDLLCVGECEEEDVRFNRRHKNLHQLTKLGWITEKTKKGISKFFPISPKEIFEIEIKKIERHQANLDKNIYLLRSVQRQLLDLFEKGITSHVFNKSEDFYRFQAEQINNATDQVIAVTDRWMLALRIEQLEKVISKATARDVKVKVVGRIHWVDGDEDITKRNEMEYKLAERAWALIKAGAELRAVPEKVRVRFMLIDEGSIFFAIRRPGEWHKGMWVKHPDFVKNFLNEADYMWKHGIDPTEKIKKVLKIKN